MKGNPDRNEKREIQIDKKVHDEAVELGVDIEKTTADFLAVEKRRFS